MTDTSRLPVQTGEVVVYLLDPNFGRPVQSWKFENREQISIGRAPDQDVSLHDPYVSRSHANLVFTQGAWRLFSLGRNGVLVDDRPLTDQLAAVRNEVTFRLGKEGPTLRFRTTPEAAAVSSTICFDALPEPIFLLDETKVQHEVGQIEEGEYFQKLQQQVAQLRRKRAAP